MTERHRGAVLLLALVFVLMLTLIAASAVRTATLELHMAGNDQFREEAGQVARAIAAEISLNPANFSLASQVGHSNCAPTDTAPDCDLFSLRVPLSAQSVPGYDIAYRVTRAAPLLWGGYPMRSLSEGEPFNAALFEVEIRVEGRHKRRGAAHVVQGIALRIPASGGADDGQPPDINGSDLYRIYWREPGSDPL